MGSWCQKEQLDKCLHPAELWPSSDPFRFSPGVDSCQGGYITCMAHFENRMQSLLLKKQGGGGRHS